MAMQPPPVQVELVRVPVRPSYGGAPAMVDAAALPKLSAAQERAIRAPAAAGGSPSRGGEKTPKALGPTPGSARAGIRSRLKLLFIIMLYA